MKIKHYILSAAATLFAVAANSQEPADTNAQETTVAVDSNFYIFLAFGQSNMEGQGNISKADRDVDERFLAMRTTDCDGELYSWRTAVPPLARCSAKLGPVDYFGRLLLDSLTPHNPNIRIGVVDVAVAGCSIDLFNVVDDKDLKYAKTVDSWMVPMINAYGGRPYQRLVESAKEAQKSGVIKGILLHQGETNTGDPKWPGHVAAIYDSLISQLNLNPEEVPLLVGEVVTSEVGGVCGSHNAVIAKVPDVVKNSYVVSAKNLAMSTADGQNVHFTASAYRVLGKRYAKQMLRSWGYEIETLPEVSVDTTITACDSYRWKDVRTTYTKSQKITKTFVTENDQDSIVNLTLIINKGFVAELDPVTTATEYTWPVDGKTYTESQTLTYEGKTSAGCDSIITCKLTISAVGVNDDIVTEKVTIYPNPAIDVLNINVPTCAVGLGKVAVYTSAGIEVFSSNFVSEFECIDISGWNSGVYMVQITDSDGNIWTDKFVKSSK